MNVGTAAALTAVVIIAVLAVRSLMKDRKKGKHSCGCGCAHCAMAGTCHKKE